MTSAQLLIGFFFFIVAAVGAAGYVFVLRPSRAEGTGGDIPEPTGFDQQLPKGQAAVADVFRLIGEAVPASGRLASAARLDLIAAGYRWPSAVSIFLGIKCAT